jgi:hypothetical protein
MTADLAVVLQRVDCMEKRQRERVRRQKQQDKEQRRVQRTVQRRERPKGGKDADLEGIIPGPQPGQIIDPS